MLGVPATPGDCETPTFTRWMPSTCRREAIYALLIQHLHGLSPPPPTCVPIFLECLWQPDHAVTPWLLHHRSGYFCNPEHKLSYNFRHFLPHAYLLFQTIYYSKTTAGNKVNWLLKVKTVRGIGKIVLRYSECFDRFSHIMKRLFLLALQSPSGLLVIYL